MAKTDSSLPEPNPQGTISSTIHEGAKLYAKLTATPLEKIIMLTLVAVIGFTLYGLLWIGPRLINDNVAVMTRFIQEEQERNRDNIKSEGDRNRMVMEAIAERNRASIEGIAKLQRDQQDATVKLLVTSVQRLSTDMGKLAEQMNRLEQVITELRKKIDPPEVWLAPYPRAKSRTSGQVGSLAR